MHAKNVLIVEDEEGTRVSLALDLKRRGFRVTAPGSAAEVQALAKDAEQDFDVVVLDMLLDRWEDAQRSRINGGDLGLEIQRARRTRPEFLITSAYAKVDYYRMAVALGAAAYLDKHSCSQDDVRRHVRALALRHALSVEAPSAMDWLDRIATSARDSAGAVLRFSQEILCPELREVLGAPFRLLVTGPRGTYCFGEAEGPPDGPDDGYAFLQSLVHSNGAETQPFCLDLQAHDNEELMRHYSTLKPFHQGVFVPLTVDRRMRVSLGIIRSPAEDVLSEDPAELAKVLVQYFRPVVLEHILRILTKCAEFASERMAVLAATSQLCLYVGQEQLSLMSRVGDGNEAESAAEQLTKVRGLAEDLQEAGGLLSGVGRQGEEKEARPDMLDVPVAEIVQSAWDELCDLKEFAPGMLKLEGACLAKGVPDDVSFAVSKVLQWLVERGLESTITPQSAIRAVCEQAENAAVITIEDTSPRLAAGLRELLFFPFTQFLEAVSEEQRKKYPGEHLPLYLARMLVEFRNDGRLEDRSDDIPGDQGHRFVITLPPGELGQGNAE